MGDNERFNRMRWPAGLTLALLLGLGWVSPALAQKPSLPASSYAASNKPAVYTGQLRMASELGRRALTSLHAIPVDEGVPIEQSSLQSAMDTYVLIRAARQGLDSDRSRQKFPDPVLELAYRRLDEAWNLSRTPVDKVSWGMSRQEYLDISIRDFSRAMVLVDQVLILLP